jgi:F0F1-type ATP synthase membrane subunit c/vacuolar-type H+-ATPase subunit K
VTDLGKFVVFKPVIGGYVYAAPSTWVVGPRDHYLVDESEKAAILAIMTSSSQSVLWIIGLSWITLSVLLATGVSLWAYGSTYHYLYSPLVIIAVILSAYAALFISRQLLLSRLRPILSALRRTNDRITHLEERQALAMGSYAVKISPTRRLVVRIASFVGAACALGILISRTIDMHAENQSMLDTFYNVNANFSGLLNVAIIIGFGIVFLSFGRDQSRA